MLISIGSKALCLITNTFLAYCYGERNKKPASLSEMRLIMSEFIIRNFVWGEIFLALNCVCAMALCSVQNRRNELY